MARQVGDHDNAETAAEESRDHRRDARGKEMIDIRPYAGDDAARQDACPGAVFVHAV